MTYYVDVVVSGTHTVTVEARNAAEAITIAMPQVQFLAEAQPLEAVRAGKRGRVPGYVRAVLRARRCKG